MEACGERDRVLHRHQHGHLRNTRKTVEATLRHLGGRKGPNATSPNRTYLEATVETNLCGNLTISLTTLPSRAQAFKALGCRVYFRGVKKAQHDIDEVRAWMAEMIDIVSP